MNEVERKYFAELTKDRKDSADTLEKPSMQGVKKSVVEKYSDQAHFIYELLQNADDAKATSARFVLHNDELIFAHNGTRKFSITNPENEGADSKNGKLGDINAITSIANSNKTESSIGKFGVGFKAVFQYTSTPYIYDDNCSFKIDRFIVPVQLNEDHPNRNSGETLFVFPFNHNDRNEEQAYEEILNKLKNLTYPILFLSNLKDVSFECGNTFGLYGKEQLEYHTVDENTQVELLKLSHNNGDDIVEENLWLFSRTDEEKRTYCVGFFTDEEFHLVPKKKTAFCFFPTKEVTNLNFIIHAPFLLTDSREGIHAGESHNEAMIELLSELSADALLHLKYVGKGKNIKIIDDTILDIIPWNKSDFSATDDMDRISFMPFYDAIKNLFEEEKIIPTQNGYAYANHAYWAFVPQISELFSTEQLVDIVEDPEAQWAFTSLSRESEQRSTKAKSDYIDNITCTFLDENIVINGRQRSFNYGSDFVKVKGIDKDFIEAQDISWLHKFYKWISEAKSRINLIPKKPIFLDKNGNAVALRDNKGDIILFLPVDGVTSYTTINEELLKNHDTKSFLKELGIKEPDRRDLINLIIAQYDEGENNLDHTENFKKFFAYYLSCPQSEIDGYIDDLSGCKFVKAISAKTGVGYYYPDEVYYPSPELREYFETKINAKFVLLNEYMSLVSSDEKNKLEDFFEAIGVNTSVVYRKRELYEEDVRKHNLPCPTHRKIRWEENYIDGLLEIIEEIEDTCSKEKSVLLWAQMLHLFEKYPLYGRSIDPEVFAGRCHYTYYGDKVQRFESICSRKLKNAAWLFNKNDEICSPKDLFVEHLSDEYDTESVYAQAFIKFLEIEDEASQDDVKNLENLSEKQMNIFQIGELCKDNGYSFEEIQRLITADMIKRNTQVERTPANTTDYFSNPSADDFDDTEEFVEDTTDEATTTNKTTPTKRKVSKTEKRILDKVSTVEEPMKIPSVVDEEEECDADDYSPKSVNYSKKIAKEEEKAAARISIIQHLEDLREIVSKSKRYSYKWFKALLELESMNSAESNFGNREISISFGKVEKDPEGKRTLILKHPSSHIPQFVEELADIPLELKYDGQSKKVTIEAASVKSYTLKIKVKSGTNINELNLSEVKEATINAQSPAFLLEELRKAFNALEYEDDFDMKENLPENIKFIFGPPGTGKTTYLSNETIIPMMQQNDKCKVLVLAPTNKAADVLVSRIMENEATSADWLVRFGVTNDENIEESGVFKEKTFDIRSMEKCVVATTIARFPYDFFMTDSERIYLNGIKWDYIVIDEASMIPIANIVYPLFKKTPKQFIIAGDPFQIEPIASVDIWKDENIYTMVELKSFINPTTKPHDFEVKLLTKQYRSIPSVGNVFSRLTYGGILEHNRTEDSQRKLNIEDVIDIGTLNVIKFPVSKYESIYRAKRLNNSSYQVYSALFTYEFVCYLSRLIASKNSESFKIGVIAPYKAQTGLIDKLLASANLPKTIDVQVDTVHSFQGDECDIIISVFNTPPTISTRKDMFLNKKNLVNVSISRARDYLFVIMPDDDTENVNNLQLIKRLEYLCKDTTVCKEFDTHSLEVAMFGDELYLEKNSFSTSHQSVNVYGLPESKYEVRSEDNAVDIQVHKQAVENEEEIEYAPPKKRVAKGNMVKVKELSTDAIKTYSVKPIKEGEDIPRIAKMFLGSTIGDVITIMGKQYEVIEII